MCTNKFSIGGLIGLHVSSIVTWGYQDNFKPVYLFFTKRSRAHKKHQNTKQATFILLKNCAREKLLPLLLSVCLILFCWLMFACECFLYVRNLFVKKKIINRLEIVLITSFHCSTLNNVKRKLLLQTKQNLFLIVTV